MSRCNCILYLRGNYHFEVRSYGPTRNGRTGSRTVPRAQPVAQVQKEKQIVPAPPDPFVTAVPAPLPPPPTVYSVSQQVIFEGKSVWKDSLLSDEFDSDKY